MNDFARGARIRKAEKDSPVPPLTMTEASLVMVDVSRRFGGITTLDEFLRYMGRAWIAYERVVRQASAQQHSDKPTT